MADEKKLGPNVTYLGNDENDKASVTMAGVTFRPGKAVNLEKLLGTKAAPVIAKLAGNTFFKVDGGPDHRKLKEEREKAEADAAKAEADAAKEQEKASNYKAPEEPTLEKRGR